MNRPATLFVILIGLMTTAGCGLFINEDTLTFPAAHSDVVVEKPIIPPSDCQLVKLTTRTGDHVVALFGPAIGADGRTDPLARDRPTVIYFYGNGSTVALEVGDFDQFRRMDVNVINPDFAGYGMSSGRASEKTWYATADATYDYLTQVHGVPPRKIILVGWSMGAAVAIDLASRRPVAGCAIFNAFTSLMDMAKRVPAWVPRSNPIKNRFDNLSKIPAVRCPLLICNGMQDWTVPPEMSVQLARASRTNVTRLVVSNAGHADIFLTGANSIYPTLREFIEANTGESR